MGGWNPPKYIIHWSSVMKFGFQEVLLYVRYRVKCLTFTVYNNKNFKMKYKIHINLKFLFPYYYCQPGLFFEMFEIFDFLYLFSTVFTFSTFLSLLSQFLLPPPRYQSFKSQHYSKLELCTKF